MLPDRVSNPGPLTYESGALPIALRGPACLGRIGISNCTDPDHMLPKEQSDQGIQCLSFTNYYIVIPNCSILGHLW